ncbi:cupin domain-containing protein [Pendulispora rubella]|uniref:Cupin domain-containing protein n=1 Tax=Pendulispora rubella TaxID=2741070 RepID=A0ABZ2L5B9_9BACT
MSFRSFTAGACVAFASIAAAGCATMPPRAEPAVARSSGETVTTNFDRVIPNIPGKSLIAVEVTYAPGGTSAPHHHANSSFIYAYVVSGTIRSQVEGEPAREFHAGESWYEQPGAHHLEGRNMSTTEPAKLLAVFIVDTNDKELTTPDK